MADLFLPKLKSNAAVAVPGSSGDWDQRPLATLDQLGEGLETEIDTGVFSVDSIPDVWARPLLFQMALYDDAHMLHDKMYGEWCGLAALIALKNWHSFPLDQKPVSLAGSHFKFAGIAEKLAPQMSLSDDTSWLELFVLRFDSQPFAMTSPTTLFCTSAEYTLPGVSWYNGRELVSPAAHLSVAEKSAVRSWLDALENALSPKLEGNPLWNSLSGIIQRFQNNLGGVSITPLGIKENVLGLAGKGVFRYLDTLPSAPAADIGSSHVKLVSTKAAASQRDVLILDENIADVWGEKKNDIVVLGGKTLANITSSGLKGSQKEFDGLALPAGAEWWSKDHIFTEKLRVVEKSDAFPGWISPSGAAQRDVFPILPVRQELLEFMPARQLANRVEIAPGGQNGSYRVRVSLPLNGTGESSRDFPVEKIFDPSEVDRLNEVPAVAVWPDFSSSSWDKYFTYYNGAGLFTAKPYPEPVDCRESRTKASNDVTKAIYENRVFPEAITCWDLTSTEFWGIVALNEPESVPSKSVTNWQVGIDFGTTNTTVYFQGGGSYGNLDFSNLLRDVTKSEEREQVDLEFLPSRPLPTPFPSIYHENRWGEEELPDGQPFYDGQIYYVPNVLEELENTVFSKNSRIHSELKWSDEPMDRIRAKAFLGQLVMQVRAEAEKQGAENVNFSYSVPTSFSEGQRDHFKQLWKNIVGAGPTPEERTESLCNALFYRNELNAPVVAGTICIDVGGESSDIAIWQNGQLCAQTSLRCASREIFGEALLKKRGLIHDILQYKTKINDIRTLEILLRVQERKAMEVLNDHNARPDYKALATHIVTGFCGILHYTGLLIRAMVGKKQLKPTFEAVYIGGNGSKMLHWANGNNFSSNAGVGKLFEKVLKDASGSPDTADFKLTPAAMLKHEVAYGLVESKVLDDEPKPMALLGEMAEDSQGNKLDWDVEVSKDLIHSGLKLDVQTAQIGSLIKSVNDFASPTEVNLSVIADVDKKLKEVRRATSNKLDGLRTLQPEDVHLEPPFIMELKKLLSELRGS